MMSINIVYLASLLILAGFFILFMTLIPRFKQKYIDHKERKALRRTVTRFRLFKMLSYLGVNFDQYINKTPLPIISKHIRNCSACQNTVTCDTCLRDGRIINDMNFCPNHQSLLVQSRLLAEETRIRSK